MTLLADLNPSGNNDVMFVKPDEIIPEVGGNKKVLPKKERKTTLGTKQQAVWKSTSTTKATRTE